MIYEMLDSDLQVRKIDIVVLKVHSFSLVSSRYIAIKVPILIGIYALHSFISSIRPVKALRNLPPKESEFPAPEPSYSYCW